jgi:pyruvate formate lyase activating enzyme
MGVHTAIETNGFLGERLTDEELKTIDLVLLGIKTWGFEKHVELTGKEHMRTLDFARRLADRRVPVWVRFVLVPGLTDDAAIITEIAKFSAGLGNTQRVEVLPFHQLGSFKWERLGVKYTLKNTKPPSADMVERACQIFRAEGLQAF